MYSFIVRLTLSPDKPGTRDPLTATHHVLGLQVGTVTLGTGCSTSTGFVYLNWSSHLPTLSTISVMVHTCNLRAWEAESGESLKVYGHLMTLA